MTWWSWRCSYCLVAVLESCFRGMWMQDNVDWVKKWQFAWKHINGVTERASDSVACGRCKSVSHHFPLCDIFRHSEQSTNSSVNTIYALHTKHAHKMPIFECHCVDDMRRALAHAEAFWYCSRVTCASRSSVYPLYRWCGWWQWHLLAITIAIFVYRTVFFSSFFAFCIWMRDVRVRRYEREKRIGTTLTHVFRSDRKEKYDEKICWRQIRSLVAENLQIAFANAMPRHALQTAFGTAKIHWIRHVYIRIIDRRVVFDMNR